MHNNKLNSSAKYAVFHYLYMNLLYVLTNSLPLSFAFEILLEPSKRQPKYRTIYSARQQREIS